MVKTPPAPIVTEEATTTEGSTSDVRSNCSEEQNQMPGTPQSMGGCDFNGPQTAQTGSTEGLQFQQPEGQVNPISPNVTNAMIGQPLMSPMCTTVVLGLPAPVPSPTGNMVCVGAPPVAPPPPAGAPPQTFYRVAYVGGIDVRAGPSVDAPKTGSTLRQNEIFAVSEMLGGATPEDRRVYLRLADGRGWAFDDRALYPNDPSVIRGHWQPQPQPVMAAPPPPMPMPPQQCMPPPQQYGVPLMPMQQAPAGYSMPPAPQPYPGQPVECGGMPYYPMYAEPGQMPLQQMNLQECDPMCYPSAYAEQAPRKWKRGKRGGAKRRPKTQGAASTEDTESTEIGTEMAAAH